VFRRLRDVATDYGFDDVARQLSDLVLHSDGTPMQDPRGNDINLSRRPMTGPCTVISSTSAGGQSRRNTGCILQNGKIHPAAPEPLWAYWYFWTEAEQYITEGQKLPARAEYDQVVLRRRLVALSTVLFEHFRLIVITLAADDDAQVILKPEQRGKPLAAMDLVRNDVFHRANRRNEIRAHCWINIGPSSNSSSGSRSRLKVG